MPGGAVFILTAAQSLQFCPGDIIMLHDLWGCNFECLQRCHFVFHGLLSSEKTSIEGKVQHFHWSIEYETKFTSNYITFKNPLKIHMSLNLYGWINYHSQSPLCTVMHDGHLLRF